MSDESKTRPSLRGRSQQVTPLTFESLAAAAAAIVGIEKRRLHNLAFEQHGDEPGSTGAEVSDGAGEKIVVQLAELASLKMKQDAVLSWESAGKPADNSREGTAAVFALPQNKRGG